MTLPDRILNQLETVDPDRARAIVYCVEMALNNTGTATSRAQLVEVAPGKALIVVGPNRSLRRIAWLRLAKIAPDRYLLVLPPDTPVDSLEVALLDLIEGLGPEDKEERQTLEELRALIGHQRRKKAVSKAELVFVDI